MCNCQLFLTHQTELSETQQRLADTTHELGDARVLLAQNQSLQEQVEAGRVQRGQLVEAELRISSELSLRDETAREKAMETFRRELELRGMMRAIEDRNKELEKLLREEREVRGMTAHLISMSQRVRGDMVVFAAVSGEQ